MRSSNEWLEDFEPTSEYLNSLSGDIFTFWQRFPDVVPHYDYRLKHIGVLDYKLEWDNVAVMDISTFENWWHNQINKKTRNMVRKAEKSGVIVKKVEPDEPFFMGVTEIYNETPIRQMKSFRHYGKNLDDVRVKFSQWLNPRINSYIGAYFGDELIGFIHLIHTNRYTLMPQILGMIEHRDKAVNNALIAKAVKLCACKNVKYLIYAKMGSYSLGKFKKNNGFEKRLVPRYYIPLNMKGKLALRFRFNWKGLLPRWVKLKLRWVRRLVLYQ